MALELQTDETPRRLVGALFFTFNERDNRLTEAQAHEWAEYLTHAANYHEELVEALRDMVANYEERPYIGTLPCVKKAKAALAHADPAAQAPADHEAVCKELEDKP